MQTVTTSPAARPVRAFDPVVSNLPPIHPQVALPADPPTDGRGLALICIDAMSYPAMQQAVKAGYMPNLKRMLEAQHFVAQPFSAGVPCTTPASLVGYAYGFNDRIPGFGWYDKQDGSHHGAADYADFEAGFEGSGRQFGGPGLFTKGSVHSSIVAGGATDTHFVLDAACQKYQAGGYPAVKKYAVDEVKYLFLHHPLQALCTLAAFPIDIIDEVISTRTDPTNHSKGWKNTWKDALERAEINILMTDDATVRIRENMKDGVPVIFTDLAGYDWAAHHHGPYSSKSLRMLHRIDKRLGQIYKEANQDGHRKYEVAVISDHGQTPGIDFRTKFGSSYMDLVNTEVQKTKPNEWPVYMPSGSLNHIYFPSRKGQYQFSDVVQQFPTLVSTLAAHPGIELVVGRQNGSTIIVGRNGMMHIHGGQCVTYGEDPLARRGPSDILAAQIDHVAQMPNSGDVILFGHWDGDKVVTFVEGWNLLGGHGGLGGDQDTPVFITEPGRKTDISKVINTEQMYPTLRSMLPVDGDPTPASPPAPVPVKQP